MALAPTIPCHQDVFDALRHLAERMLRRRQRATRDAVMRALKQGRIDVLVDALRARPSLATDASDQGWTLLHEAAHLRQPRAVELLLAAGADPDAATRVGVTPLALAVASRDLGTVTLLATASADLSLPLDEQGRTALHIAVERCDRGMAELLLRFGANPHALDFRYTTPWGRAIDTPLFPLLAAAPAPQELAIPTVDRARGQAEPPRSEAATSPAPWSLPPRVEAAFSLMEARLLRAIAAASPRHISALIEDGANFKVRDDQGRTVLSLVAEKGLADVVRLLIDRGADVNAAPPDTGLTALHMAAAAGHDEIVGRLITSGARIDATDAHGRTALHHAAAAGQTLCVARLLSAGAYVDTADVTGSTPLHLASARRGDAGPRVQTLSLLLARSADVHARDAGGRLPIHHAARTGCTWTVRILAQRGSDLRARDVDGLTPRDHAANDDVLPLLTSPAPVAPRPQGPTFIPYEVRIHEPPSPGFA